MDPPSERRGAVSLGPELRQWFGWVHGNLSDVPLPPPAPPLPPPPVPPIPDPSIAWDETAHFPNISILEEGRVALWPISHGDPPGIPQPFACNSAVRTAVPLPDGGNGTIGLALQLEGGSALTGQSLLGSVGVCSAPAQAFVTAQHAKSIPLNQSWLYNSLGKLVGGGDTKPASPWGQQKTPAANLSVSLR